jgi:hypothetical protein
MKTLKLTAAFFISGIISLSAQDVKWTYIHDGNYHVDDEAGFSIQGYDGKIYSSGAVDADSTSQAFIARLDLQGNPSWTYTYSDFPNKNSFLFVGKQDSNMNLYFGGEITDTVTHSDILIVSLDTNGTQRWTYQYDNGVQADDFMGYGLTVGTDGNIYMPMTTRNVNGNTDLSVLSLTSSGVFRWAYHYDGPAMMDDACYTVMQGTDGNLYAAGNSTGIGTNHDYTIVSLDTLGNQRWVYRKNWNANGVDEEYFTMAFDANYNIYTCGDLQDTAGQHDYAVISLDNSGNERWIYTKNGPGNYDDICHSIVLGPDGNLYTTGVSKGFNTDYDAIVISLTTSGSERWVYRYNGIDSTKDDAQLVNYGYDGNIYFSGYANDSANRRDWMIGCLNNLGVQKWVTIYNGTGNGQDEARPVFQATDGTIVSSGFTTNSFARDFTLIGMCNHPTGNFSVSADSVCVGSQITFTNSSSEAFQYEWLDNGNPFSSSTNLTQAFTASGNHNIQLIAESGGCTDTASYNIFVNANPVVTVTLPFDTACQSIVGLQLTGGLPSGGTWSGAGVSGNIFDASLLPIGNSFIVYSYTNSVGCTTNDTSNFPVSTCLGMETVQQNNSISIYPNPFSFMTTIEFSSPSENGDLFLYDVSGRMVKTISVPAGTTSLQLERGDLSEGIYFYNLFINEKISQKGKIIVE